MAQIPRYIDAPPQMLWWELDEVLVLFVAIIVGILTRQLTYLLIVGGVSVYIISKVKSAKSDGFVFHFFYWIGMPTFQFRRGPSGVVREFIE